MTKILTISKGEFYRYFISPLAYVYLICFLLLNGSFSLYFGGIFSSGSASLQPMFDFLPWILLLFIPGIAMRLWAEEFKSGTILQIMTLPVPANAFVWGKFLAAWAFCSLALLLTFPFIITVNILGNPDNTVILNSYLGAVLLSGAMLTVSQTASALTKNQVIALVFAVLLNLLFFLSGLEYILGFFRGFVPAYIIDTISSFSFLTRAYGFNSGVFEASDFIFFATLIIMFNFFTLLIINFKTSGALNWLKTSSAGGSFLAAALVFSAFIGINLAAGNFLRQYRFDFTEEKLFTPTESTRKILQNLSSPVTAKIYYSPILGERNEQMRLFFDKLRLTLRIYQKLSDGKFSYRIYDPEPLGNIEDRAIQAGIQPLYISDMNAAAYFGIVLVNENGQSRTIPFLPLERQNFLEQDLTENIYLLEHTKQPLGILSSLPILGASTGNMISQPWMIIDELQKYYTIKLVKEPEDLNDIKLLMIIHPQGLSPEMEQAIYTFSTSGGKILAFFDIAPEALAMAGPQTSLSKASDYGNLPQKWGFHFYADQTVADIENASQITMETADYAGTTQDLIQFYLTPQNFFSDLPETAGLKKMLLTSASRFMPLKEASVYFVPLIQASRQSQILPASVVTKNIHPAEILRNFKADTTPKYLAAHIIGQQPGNAFEIIVVGDSDLLYNSFWATTIPVGNNEYLLPLLDNGNFVLNALDVLSGNNALISLRGKTKLQRPYASLEKEQKKILQQFKIKEKDIFDQISQIKKGLAEIWNKKDFEGRTNFTPEELSIINKIKKSLEEKRLGLFKIRRELNRNLQQTEFLVKLFNIYAVPVLILFGLGLTTLKKINLKKTRSFRLNKRFAILFCISAICLSLGLYSVALLPERNIPPYEGKPLFQNLADKINNVSVINLRNHNAKLSFIKKGNIWTLAEQPEFMVNQNRIKSFLAALLQASIYEKKADKIENLPRFGLLPLDNPESKTTFIELQNAAGNNILNFEVGAYNIELGRGAFGAYIRLPGQFQIWLAEIELVDLNMNYHYWTYAHIWNLQFGRLSAVNKKTDENYIVDIARLLLNTELFASDVKETEEQILSLNMDGEYFKDLTLNFYKQDKTFYMQFNFNGVINNPVLEAFAQQTKNKFYTLSATDMEKLNNAVNSKSVQ